MIKYKNITHSFEGRRLFENYSLEIARSENVCFAGPSGRGKTTLLKMIPGLVVPDSGKIYIDGLDFSAQNINEIRRRISWIPQNINLPVNNALELMNLLHLSNKKIDIAANINKLGLDDSYFEKEFNDISGGEKQRIVIAVSLTKDKPIVVMDEPTAALDKHSIELLGELIANLNDKTIVSASHNQQWLKLTGRVVEI